MIYLIIIILTFFAGFIQSVIGFGAGIIIMTFLPFFIKLSEAVSFTTFVSLFLVLFVLKQYFKNINLQLIILPALIYMLGSYIAVFLIQYINIYYLKIIFSIFLILLSIYFIYFGNKVKVKLNFKTTFICSFISGLCAGLFAIGGPLMALYYLILTNNKKEYIGTIQAHFLITSIFNIALRFYKNMFNINLLHFSIVGIIFILLGVYVGNKVLDKFNENKLKYLIYIIIGFSGILNLIATIIK